jgi:hypothetical protein
VLVDVSDVANPMFNQQYINIGGSPNGTLFIVWSNAKNLLYTSHRRDGTIFAFPPQPGAAPQAVINTVGQQPTGLALDAAGLTLYIGLRSAGQVASYALAGPQPVPGAVYDLPDGESDNAIHPAADRSSQIFATSTRPNDGIFFKLNPLQPQVPVEIDTQGSQLGPPAIAPDGSSAYVARGNQNDMANVDLANSVLLPGFIAAGNQPSSVAIIAHAAGHGLTLDPVSLVMACQAPQEVMVRAFDACGNELQGIALTALVSSPALLAATPPNPVTPARYQVECLQGGSHTVTFSTTAFPFVSVELPVTCNCPVRRCVDFSTLAPGPLPPAGVLLAGVFQVSVVVQGIGSGPAVRGTALAAFEGTVRFLLNAGLSISNLVIRYRRRDPFTPLEEAIVTHAGGVTTVQSNAGLSQGQFTITCPFEGITEWLLRGGRETLITEFCFDATF